MGKIRLVLRLTFLTCIPIFPAATESLRIEWIPGEVGPESWMVSPASPTVEDVIHFSGPTGLHSSSCYAEAFAGGSPALSIAPAKRTVALWFQPPAPQYCPAVYDPVCGLEGEFGPLTEGDWLFFCNNPIAQFSFSFHVSAIPTYVLNVKVVGEGSVSLDPPPPYRAGDNVTLLAEPHPGWSFLKWSGDIPPENETDNPLTLTIDGDKTVTATFSRLPRPLSVPGDYPTIQAAIDAAPDGDTIVVSPGTYVENVHFLGKNVTLRSTDPTDPDIVAATIVDGNQAGSVVTFAGTENESCVLTGFTIRNGKADYGAGICGGTWDQHTHATILCNVIASNWAGGDEARYACGGGLAYCDGLIEENTISGNTGTIAGLWSWSSEGGGLYRCDGVIRNNTISDNSAGVGGGLYWCAGVIEGNRVFGNFGSVEAGGGLASCDGVVRNNTIVGNSTRQWGGGLADCDGLIESNIICGNSARKGGGLYSCRGIIRNNVIAWNAADQGEFGDQDGGAVCFFTYPVQGSTLPGSSTDKAEGGLPTQSPAIVNCTIVGNSAARSGGGVAYCYYPMSDCIIWGNAAPDGAQIYSSNAPSYSCIQDWTEGGEGNVSEPPSFVDPDGPDNDPRTYADNDYRLLPDSPSIDAGKNQEWMWSAVDLEGKPRILFGVSSLTVDMGAYERKFNLNVLTLRKDSDTLTQLTWSSRAGIAYTIVSSADLLSGLWAEEATIVSAGPSSTWTDPETLSRQKFYRIAPR